MQIIRKTGAVSGTAQALDAVGGRNELMYDMEKTMKVWKIEAEQQLIWGATASGDSTGGTAREMRGLEQAIARTALLALPVPLLLQKPCSTTSLQAIWNAGGEDMQLVAFCGGLISAASASLLLPTPAN
jgi:hypothetical protein